MIMTFALNIFGVDKKTEAINELRSSGLQIIKSGTKAPDFNISGFSGKNVKLSEYKGKVVLLNFWASWCPPCKAEMPSIQKLYDTLKSSKFTVMAIDVGEPKENGANYIKNNKFTFPVFFDAKNDASSEYSVSSIPATYIIDKNGYLIAGMIGSFEWDNEKVVKALDLLASVD